MRIKGIEHPLIKLPEAGGPPSRWCSQFVESSGFTGKPFYLSPDVWESPKTPRDVVLLPFCLNYAGDIEAKRAVIQAALECTNAGGLVLAWARACDSGFSLAERMVSHGVDPEKLGISNLSNKDIIGLRPDKGFFIQEMASFRAPRVTDVEDLELFHAFATEVRKSLVDPDIRAVPRSLATTLITVGLVWQKPNQQK